MEEPGIKNWLDVEFNHAKYSKNSWGRAVIQAIDLDDSIALFNCMGKPGANINAQIDILGYDQYLWTCMVHKYLGDTALHLAMRQRKMMCVHMLLLLKARTDLSNQSGETADSLSIKLFGTSAKNLEYEAFKFILNRTPLKDIPKLPDDPRYRNIEREAWKLMEQGRVLYTELPKSFGESDPILEKHLFLIRKNYLSFNLPKKTSSSTISNPSELTSAEEKEKENKEISPTLSPEIIREWELTADADGNEYYYNSVTGESSWQKPAAFISPSASPSHSPARSAAHSAASSPLKGAQMNTSGKVDKRIDVSKPGSAKSSASNSRAGSPGALPTSPGNQSKRPNLLKGSPTKSGTKGGNSKTRSAYSDDDNSESEDSLAKARNAARAKAAGEDSSSSSDDSSGSSEDSVKRTNKAVKKANKSASKQKKKKKKKIGMNRIDESPKKVRTPPKMRTLRQQYEDAGGLLGQRAEIEVLREDCRGLETQLKNLITPAKVTGSVSVPPLPQDYAMQVNELEQKLLSMQAELTRKSRDYYAGFKLPAKSLNGGTGTGVAHAGLMNGASDPTTVTSTTLRSSLSMKGGTTKFSTAQSEKVKTGVAVLPASVRAATGDVWGRNNLCDVIYLIERQKALYYERLAASQQPVAKGLKLLESVKITNAAERIVAHEQNSSVGQHDPMYMPEELEHLQGIKKLKFMNLNKLRAMARGGASAILDAQQQRQQQQQEKEEGDVKAQKERKNAASRLARAVSDKILYQQESFAQESMESGSLAGSISKSANYTKRRHYLPTESEFQAMRNITVFSTRSNMKYMKIGDEGLESLGQALRNDEIVAELCLAGARISSAGMSIFCKMMPDIKALRHLDFSNNAICDKGASALALALPYCVLLEQVNLAGNRISGVGGVKLIQSVFDSPTTWLSLKNNYIKGDEAQSVLKLLEEHNYASEQSGHIFEHRPLASVGVHLAEDDEQEGSGLNSSMHEKRRVLKMFVL